MKNRALYGVLLHCLVAMLFGIVAIGSASAQSGSNGAVRIDIIGDLQKTNSIEEFLIAREQNDEVRTQIVGQVARDKPDLLLLLGDQVSSGESESDWQLFDELMKPVTDQKIRTLAVIGNHDYGFTNRNPQNLRYFYDRFGIQSRDVPVVERLGKGVVLVMLNSNFDMLSPDEYRRQATRFAELLEKLDKDPEVRGVIVASHHPPYSNSSLGNDQGVIDMFARPFLQARKTRLFLAGHVHSYERFVSGDKMFVVSGGGGGPRRQCNTSPTRACKNDAYREGELRPFHFIRLTINDNSLQADVMMLRQRKGKKDKEFVVGDKFNIGIYGTVPATNSEGEPKQVVEKTPDNLTK